MAGATTSILLVLVLQISLVYVGWTIGDDILLLIFSLALIPSIWMQFYYLKKWNKVLCDENSFTLKNVVFPLREICFEDVESWREERMTSLRIWFNNSLTINTKHGKIVIWDEVDPDGFNCLVSELRKREIPELR